MEPSQASTILLTNGLILTHPGLSEPAPHGTTVISGNRLEHVNLPKGQVQETAIEVIDCSNCLIMPGLVNAHTHAAMSILRGVADDLPLDKWLNQYIFPSESKHVARDFVRLGTMLSAVEMALAGVTTFADGYFFMEQAAEATLQVGLRAVIAQGILDVPTPDAPTPGSWRGRAEEFLTACPKDSLITPALFCHSPYLCSPETFRAARELAGKHDTLLFSHVAETSWEVAQIQRSYGRRPVEHLEQNGILDRDFVAVHCVHLSGREKDILAQTRTGVVHCPESNMKLSSGAAPVMDLLSKGISVALGTDGPASNNNLDMFEEMRSASFLAKLANNDPEALNACSVIQMATLNGAAVLQMNGRIGSLENGKLADLIIIDLDRPHLIPAYDVVSHMIYSARGSDVRDVIVDGRLVVRQGKVTTVNEEELTSRVRVLAGKIASDLNIRTHGVCTTDV
jgi:5-methylthioadenosine/S-adenosylhomocysteine deaminase